MPLSEQGQEKRRFVFNKEAIFSFPHQQLVESVEVEPTGVEGWCSVRVQGGAPSGREREECRKFFNRQERQRLAGSRGVSTQHLGEVGQHPVLREPQGSVWVKATRNGSELKLGRQSPPDGDASHTMRGCEAGR